MFITDRVIGARIRTAFDSLGAKPPKEVADAFARLDKISEGIPTIANASGELNEAVTAALLAGVEPATDATVQKALTAQALSANHALPEAVVGAAYDVVRDAVMQHLDSIVESWGKAVHSAAARLRKAHERLGDVSLDETGTILAQGGDAANVWADAQGANGTIAAALEAWTALMQFIRFTPNADQRALRLAPMTLEQYRELPPKLDGWGATLAGLDIDLPTLDEFRARVADIAAEAAQVDMVVDPLRSHNAGHAIRVPAGSYMG